VAALEATETLALGGAAFDDLRRRHAEVERALVAYLGRLVRDLSTRLAEALYVPADKRVLRRLLDLDALYGGGAVPLTQEDLATLAGTTRPTANRALQGAVDAGWVALGRGRLEVLDREALVRRVR
jgi:CRP-like cAMP-binding protein